MFIFIEGEASRLARDFTYLSESEFPTRATADYCMRHVDPSEYHNRKNMALASK